MQNILCAAFFLLYSTGSLAAALPSHFGDTIGSALDCHNQVTAKFLNKYMKRFLGQPEFVDGGANWWRVDSTLYGASVKYVFVGVTQDFIGATFMDPPIDLIKKLEKLSGEKYTLKKADVWENGAGRIIKYNDRSTPSKMFCLGAPSNL